MRSLLKQIKVHIMSLKISKYLLYDRMKIRKNINITSFTANLGEVEKPCTGRLKEL